MSYLSAEEFAIYYTLSKSINEMMENVLSYTRLAMERKKYTNEIRQNLDGYLTAEERETRDGIQKIIDACVFELVTLDNIAEERKEADRIAEAEYAEFLREQEAQEQECCAEFLRIEERLLRGCRNFREQNIRHCAGYMRNSHNTRKDNTRQQSSKIASRKNKERRNALREYWDNWEFYFEPQHDRR